jgi:hypothetical protein
VIFDSKEIRVADNEDLLLAILQNGNVKSLDPGAFRILVDNGNQSDASTEVLTNKLFY